MMQMLKTDKIYKDGKEYYHTYSDSGNYILGNDGVLYIDAIDAAEKSYIETDKKAVTISTAQYNALMDAISNLQDGQKKQDEAIEAGASGLEDLILTMAGGD